MSPRRAWLLVACLSGCLDLAAPMRTAEGAPGTAGLLHGASLQLPEDLRYPGLPGEPVTLHLEIRDAKGLSLGLPEANPAFAGMVVPVSRGEQVLMQLVGRDWVTPAFEVQAVKGLTRLELPAWEPGLSFSGRVVLPGGEQDLTGVTVQPEGLPRRVWTDAQGGFTMTGLPSGRHRFSFTGPGLAASVTWESTTPALNLQVPLTPMAVPGVTLIPAYGVPGDTLEVQLAEPVPPGLRLHFQGADGVLPVRTSSNSWSVSVPTSAESGPVRAVLDGRPGEGTFWHRIDGITIVGLPELVPSGTTPQPILEGWSLDGFRILMPDSPVSLSEGQAAGINRITATAQLGAWTATVSAVVDDARVRRMAPVPDGVRPYALSPAPDGGWLLGDYLGERCFHRSLDGSWHPLDWQVDRPRALAADGLGRVYVLGRTGPGLDALRVFAWPASEGIELSRGAIDAFMVHADGRLWLAKNGKVVDQSGDTVLSGPPGSRIEAMAVGHLGQTAVAGPGLFWMRWPGDDAWQVVQRSPADGPSGEVRGMAWQGDVLYLVEHAKGRLWRWTREGGFRQLAGAGHVGSPAVLEGQDSMPALGILLGRPTSLLPIGDGRVILADPMEATLLEWRP
ncbi:MAG: hypothetical protein VKP57_03515 [Candidatus Sericytochromatia bacterium]|nr:hypothetical protein [Candidatus Sericytochromatia bacterium]